MGVAPLRFSTAAPAAPHIADKTGAQRRRVRFWEEKGPGFVRQLRLPEPRSIPGTSVEAELGAAARHVSRASGSIRLLRACKRPGRWFGLLYVNELPKGHLSIKNEKYTIKELVKPEFVIQREMNREENAFLSSHP